MSHPVIFRSFADRESCNEALAGEVAMRLVRDLAASDSCSLVLPGGETPAAFITALASADLPWSRIRAVPSDERLVPSGLPERTDGMLAHYLGSAIGRGLELTSLAAPEPVAGEAVQYATQAIASIPLPPSVAILGLGTDGHIASLFPGSAARPQGNVVLELHSPKPPAARISLSLGCLEKAGFVAVLAFGEEKKDTLGAALQGRPFDLLVEARAKMKDVEPVEVFWAS